MQFPKANILRSEAYRRYVASQACFGCGIEGYSQCAHANVGKGLSMKSSDLDTFPLCAPHFGRLGCHQEHDLCLGMSRDTRRELERKYIERMHDIARADGRHEFKEAA